MKLALGTAQFGMDYGISNRIGQTPAEEAAAILARALDRGVEVLDTAPAYGVSEQVLGESGLMSSFRIVTKTPVMTGIAPAMRADLVERALHESLSRLGVDRVAGLLVHAVADLMSEDGELLAARLMQLKEEGLTEAVGVSAYSGSDLRDSARLLTPDLVQVPASVYDQRMLRDGSIEMLADADVEVHVRSALLQGVLVMAPDDIPQHLAGLREHHRQYFDAIDARGLSPLQAALGFALGMSGPTAVVVGVNTLDQLEELLRVEPLDPADFARWALDDPDLVNPARWRLS